MYPRTNWSMIPQRFYAAILFNWAPSLEGGNRLRTFPVRVLPLRAPRTRLASALGESKRFVRRPKNQKTRLNLIFFFKKKICKIQKSNFPILGWHFCAKKASVPNPKSKKRRSNLNFFSKFFFFEKYKNQISPF